MPNSRFALWSGRALLALALFIGIVSIFGYGRYARFHNRIETLKSNGELPSVEELRHEVERPEDDALFYLRQILDSAQQTNSELSVLEGERVHKLEGEPKPKKRFARTDDESIALFDQLMSEYPDLFPTISLAAAAPQVSYNSVIASDDPIDAIELVPLMRMVDWKCEVQISRGEVDEAVDSAIELFRLGKLMSKHGTLIDKLLGIAMHRASWLRLAQASAEKSLSDEKRNLVDSLLNDVDYMEDFRKCLLSERSMVICLMMDVDREVHTDPLEFPMAWLATRFQFGPAMVAGNEYLDCMETALKTCELPLSEEVIFGPNDRSFLLDSVGGNSGSFYERIRLTFGEATAESRILQIVLALDAAPDAIERDNWPVEYLVSIGVAEEATIDPFDDKPMRIRRENERWIVYSCGRDRQDDGGNWQSDCGIFRWSTSAISRDDN